MTTLEIKFSRPDNLAKEAAQAGLLSDAEIEKLFCNLRQHDLKFS